MFLAIMSFFTANYSATKVSTSYEDILDYSLPIMNKSSHVAQLSAQIEAHLFQLRLDAMNNTNKLQIKKSQIDALSTLWIKTQNILNELSHYTIHNNKQLQDRTSNIKEYLEFMPELLKQINLLKQLKQKEHAYIGDIETIINYNNKILLAEIESFWHEVIKSVPEQAYMDELEYSHQFYKNSAQLLSYFRQTFLTTDIKTLNILKRESVKLYRQMDNSGSSNYEYKLFADALLEQVKPIYAGKQSLFKVRYDVLRLTNISNSLIEQQIDTAKEIEKISDAILLQVQNALTKQKTQIKKDLNKSNQFLFVMVIISFIISLFAVWFLVNKNLIRRITTLRSKILELAKGNTDVDITINGNDEIGDMEHSLTQLKEYVSKAKILSITDPLTGLLNHTQFTNNLKIEIRRHARHNQYLSLAIIDIDYFKNYNDHYGHPQGDVCLKEVAQLIANTCKRAGEYAYRIGGEEFAIIMPNTTAQEQYEKLKKVQAILEETNIEHLASDISNKLTISVGIYSCQNNKYVSSEEFYKHADKALYEAKKSRNSIVLSQCEI